MVEQVSRHQLSVETRVVGNDSTINEHLFHAEVVLVLQRIEVSGCGRRRTNGISCQDVVEAGLLIVEVV